VLTTTTKYAQVLRVLLPSRRIWAALSFACPKEKSHAWCLQKASVQLTVAFLTDTQIRQSPFPPNAKTQPQPQPQPQQQIPQRQPRPQQQLRPQLLTTATLTTTAKVAMQLTTATAASARTICTCLTASAWSRWRARKQTSSLWATGKWAESALAAARRAIVHKDAPRHKRLQVLIV